MAGRVSDIQGRKEAPQALKPGEGESSQAATANVLRNKPLDLSSQTLLEALSKQGPDFQKTIEKHNGHN